MQGEVVGLRSEKLVRARHDGLAVVDERLVSLEPIRPRPGEALNVEGAAAVEHMDVVHQLLERPLELPPMVQGEVVMRRDEDWDIHLPRPSVRAIQASNRAFNCSAAARVEHQATDDGRPKDIF